MTSGPDRSLTGLSLPKWMKTKISDRSFDFEGNAFSPPSGDDGFILVRYKKPAEEPTQPKVITAPKYTPISSLFEVKKEVNLTNHTSSCKEFIPNAKITPREIGLRSGIQEGFLKSTGIDDGFKGEGAACGYSVVAVAHQMIAERKTGADDLIIPKSQRVRRNSRSLPSSPLSSPKLLRKNPYFTSILFGSSERVSSLALATKGSSSEDSFEDLPRLSSSGRVSSEEGSPPSSATLPPHVLKAKPSELREMNFWSPTSM